MNIFDGPLEFILTRFDCSILAPDLKLKVCQLRIVECQTHKKSLNLNGKHIISHELQTLTTPIIL